MYYFDDSLSENFKINQAYITISAAAALYLNKGHKHIWIYLKDNMLKFFPVEFVTMSEFFVAHFRCQKILDGLNDKAWNKLGRNLARKLLEQKP